MSRARTDVGEAKLFQMRTDVSFAIVNGEPLFDDPLKIDPPPANDAILLAVGSCLDDSSQFLKLFSPQPWFNAACMDVAHPLRSMRTYFHVRDLHCRNRNLLDVINESWA